MLYWNIGHGHVGNIFVFTMPHLESTLEKMGDRSKISSKHKFKLIPVSTGCIVKVSNVVDFFIQIKIIL